MSKTSLWQPPTKWGEDQDSIRPLPAVRIRGAGNSPEEMEAAYAEHSANIRQFHMAQAHAYSLSLNNIHRAYGEWPGAQAMYTNINGQEYIDVKLTTNKKLGDEEEKIKNPWDWALVELSIPNVNISTGVKGAVIKAHRKSPAPNETGIKFAGYAFDNDGMISDSVRYWSDGLDPFVISFAPHNAPLMTVIEGSDVTQVSSLLVDMRRFPGMPVVIDIYGYLDMGGTSEEVPSEYSRDSLPHTISNTYVDTGVPVSGFPGNEATLRAQWPYGTGGTVYLYPIFGGSSLYSTNAPYNAYVGSLPGGLSPPGANVLAPANPPNAAAVDNSGGPTWVNEKDLVIDPASGLVTQVTEESIADFSSTGGGPNFLFETQVIGWNITTHTTSVFTRATPETRSAEITGIGGWGWLDWVQTLFVATDSFAQWDVRKELPKHISTVQVGTASIATNYTDGDPFRLLGTVTIDPTLHSITFTAAKL